MIGVFGYSPSLQYRCGEQIRLRVNIRIHTINSPVGSILILIHSSALLMIFGYIYMQFRTYGLLERYSTHTRHKTFDVLGSLMAHQLTLEQCCRITTWQHVFLNLTAVQSGVAVLERLPLALRERLVQEFGIFMNFDSRPSSAWFVKKRSCFKKLGLDSINRTKGWSEWP